MMRSRGADARAACTEALGVHDSITSAFSLHVSPEPLTVTKVIGIRDTHPAPPTAPLLLTSSGCKDKQLCMKREKVF